MFADYKMKNIENEIHNLHITPYRSIILPVV